MHQQTERLESLKAGLVGGLSTGLVFLLILLFHRSIDQLTLPATLPLPIAFLTNTGLTSLFAAGITGFLFGVTYRYIVRQDTNPHLRSGAVLAFGLVRGLAQIETGFTLTGTLWPGLLAAAESLLMIAIARFFLDWTMTQSWVKPFDGTEAPAIEKANAHQPPSKLRPH